MPSAIAEVTSTKPKRRRFRATPDRLAAGLLAIVVMLWLVDRFHGFGLFYQRGWAVLIARRDAGQRRSRETVARRAAELRN